MIDRENGHRALALGEVHQRCIGKIHGAIRIARHQGVDRRQFRVLDGRELNYSGAQQPPNTASDLIPIFRPKLDTISDEERGKQMPKQRLSDEQILTVVKQMEAGRTAAELAREVGVSQHTIYAWKAKFGGMESNDVVKLRHLEDENGRLKKLVADLSLDREMLKALLIKNGLSS